MAPFAELRFPGLHNIESADITIGHGSTPSVFNIRCVPQANTIREGGTLEGWFGGQLIFRFPDCKIDSGSIESSESGRILALPVLDSRWKLVDCGAISGEYNLRQDDGKIVKAADANKKAKGQALIDTERTPQELAKLLMEAAGITNYHVGDLPNDARPTRQWDYALPGPELSSLAEELGCRVVMELDGRIALRRLGLGPGGKPSPLPPGPLTPDFSEGIDPPERPDSLIIVGGKVRYQVDIPLEAVGLDVDGKIKPIDLLSYAPAAGWPAEPDFESFTNIADKTARNLAKRTVWRWYRLKPPFYVPGYGLIKNIEQVLPIEDEQVDVIVDEDDEGKKEERNRKAEVFGVWYRASAGGLTNTATTLTPLPDTASEYDTTIVDVDFTINCDKGIVKFSEPVYKFNASGAATTWAVVKPQLRLRTALSVRDPETRGWVRSIRERKNSGDTFGTKPRYIKREEIVLWHRPNYAANYQNEANTKTQNNEKDTVKECDYYLDAIEREYQLNNPQTARYAGWIRIPLDGAIQSVTYTVGPGGAFTIVQRNQDQGIAGVLPYKLMRKIEKDKNAQRDLARLLPQNQKRESKQVLGGTKPGGA